MAFSDKNIQSIKKRAENKFLGHYHVVGIGITGKKPDRLVFFLERASEQSEAKIDNWAKHIGIPYEILVIGEIKLVATTNGNER